MIKPGTQEEIDKALYEKAKNKIIENISHAEEADARGGSNKCGLLQRGG